MSWGTIIGFIKDNTMNDVVFYFQGKKEPEILKGESIIIGTQDHIIGQDITGTKIMIYLPNVTAIQFIPKLEEGDVTRWKL